MNPIEELNEQLAKTNTQKLEMQLKSISPDEGKYGEKANKLRNYLSAEAEWNACAYIQYILLETRMEFGKANKEDVETLKNALPKFKATNAHLLEDILRHDQLAVIEELGQVTNEKIKSLLHPGTTSYDVLDTARAYLLKKMWNEELRTTIKETINKLANLAERTIDKIQVGRTHLQYTSPVTFGLFLSNYAARLTDRVEKLDDYFNDLRGKISGIVGTYAGIEQIIGNGKGIEFEKKVLDKLDLKPDYTATQITMKERITDIGHGIVTLARVLGDFANNIRILYGSDIQEVTSMSNSQKLGLSSTDANKNNPVNWENIAGTIPVIESGMRVLYEMMQSDLQRDLRGSVQARYQPGQMITETYRIFKTASKAIDDLALIEDGLTSNLENVRKNPSEALVTILRGEEFIHSKYGVGHDFAKEMSKRVRKNRTRLIDEALKDEEFKTMYQKLTDTKQKILNGEVENYLGSAKEKTIINIEYARSI